MQPSEAFFRAKFSLFESRLTNKVPYSMTKRQLWKSLHSYLGAGAKTSLGVCFTELKH
jgi:hypothetical protein